MSYYRLDTKSSGMGLSRSATSAKHPHIPKYQAHIKTKAHPNIVTISWNNPNPKAGVIGSEIAGTEISWRLKTSPYWNTIDIKDPTLTSYKLELKDGPGTYQIRVASFDVKDRHSNYTTPIEVTIAQPS